MSLVPKEILLSHLQRAEGAEEVTLPIDFFRDLLYQAMPRTWIGLTDEEILSWWSMDNGLEDLDMCSIVHFRKFVEEVEARLKRKNT